MTSIRLAIASDLHYVVPSNGGVSLPAAANSNPANDPMQGLLARIEKEATLEAAREFEADYLICPGDVTNQASPAGFEEGWARLKALQAALGARHLLATTGNHEVHSRAGGKDDVVGLSTQTLDPLAAIQRHADYPCTCLNDGDRWVYWGRGYQIVEEPNILFVIINSSHFHPTTRANEFERGRISDIALEALRTELSQCIAEDKNRIFVALLHHHPIPHEAGTAPEENIQMHNGSQLVRMLDDTNVAWLVIHGHKHEGRLIQAQGSNNPPTVFAAASFGAALDGVLAFKTRQQFYILDLEVCDHSIEPTAKCRVRAWHWTGTSWEPASKHADGLPDRCGYQLPPVQRKPVLEALLRTLTEVGSFLKWDEAVARHPELGYLSPDQVKFMKTMMSQMGIQTTWDDDDWFPQEVGV